MSDYSKVEQSLTEGADPAMLCTTCPWDRYCVTPPPMTKADVDKAMGDAKAKDDEQLAEARAAGKEPGMPVGMLVTAMVMGGRHQQAAICPVYALRLRSSRGRDLVDQVKAAMQEWDDQS